MKEVTLDTTGKLCPIPVLKARRAMESLSIGDVLVIIATDMGSKKDIPHFCDISGHKLETIQEFGNSLVFRVVKG